MTLTAILGSIALIPIYLALRWPFFRLPLHMDTGYYVSNYTVCRRKLDFSKGWNARYAGCSKVVPELFYSTIFLIHGGGDKYKFFSRFYYSIYCFVVAMLVGYASSVLSGGTVHSYFVGLIIYCLLSSEAHYGIYFESGEQFELLPHVLGILLILIGLRSDVPWMMGAGVGLWAWASCFIKLSSLPAVVILGAGLGYLSPKSVWYSLLFSLAAALVYLWWIMHNGQNIRSLLRPLMGHQLHYHVLHFGHKFSLKTYLMRFLFKAGLLFFILLSHPIIPAAAFIGVLSGHDQVAILSLYLFAVSVCYIIQAAYVWYYTIPFLPVIALFAAFGIETIVRQNRFAWVIPAGLLLVWSIMHVRRAYGSRLKELNKWTWLPHHWSVPGRNLDLDQAAGELRGLIQKNSLLVYGHYNQAYVLVGTAYPVSIVAPNKWLDLMHPDWEKKFNEKLVADPPKFILDSDRRFDNDDIRRKLGLSYGLSREFPGDFRLFKLDGSVAYSPGTHSDQTASKVVAGG